MRWDEYTAIFERRGRKSGHLLMQDIRYLETGEQVRDHMWLPARHFSGVWLKRGDRLVFQARLTSYYHRRKQQVKLKLVAIRRVRLAETPPPAPPRNTGRGEDRTASQ